MTDEDKLIRQFLQKNIPTPEDNGFSERVMSRLPYRPINTKWVVVGEIVTLIVGCFFLLRHVDFTKVFCDFVMHVMQWGVYLQHIDFSINPLYIFVAALALLTVWGANRIKALT